MYILFHLSRGLCVKGSDEVGNRDGVTMKQIRAAVGV